MVYGYCRISTDKQNIERQERNIKKEYKDALIVKEAYTGTKINRKEFNKILEQVKAGDTIVFDSVSRMSRNAEDGFKLYKELFNKDINLIFLKESYINTQVFKAALSKKVDFNTQDNKILELTKEYINNLLEEITKEQIKIAFNQAQKEVDDLRQRTKEGIQTARLNGKQIGNKKGCKLNVKKKEPIKEKIKEKSKTFNGTYTDKDLIKVLGIARNTYFKYKKELKEEQERG